MICICGHDKKDHMYLDSKKHPSLSRYTSRGEHICELCRLDRKGFTHHTFKLANLYYLEMKYNESKVL